LSQASDLAVDVGLTLRKIAVNGGFGRKRRRRAARRDRSTKKFQVFLNWNYQQSWTLYLNLIRNSDSYSAEDGIKERGHLAFGSSDGRWQMFLQRLRHEPGAASEV